MDVDRITACLWGALVADAACLGLHWLYDPERVALVSKAHGSPAFAPVDASYFIDAKGYFAHGARLDGQLTQYGECLRLAIGSMIETEGVFDVDHHQKEFLAFFGAGGSYSGYIDQPTRGALENMANATRTPTGIDDDQHPAIARVPALVAGAGDLQAAIEVTNVNADALIYGNLFAGVLHEVLDGSDLRSSLEGAANQAPDEQKRLLTTAFEDDRPPVEYAGDLGRACHLPMGMPVAFHIMLRSESYREAVEQNILAGGDSAGRAIIIGATMAAHYGLAGIPLEWSLRVRDGAALFDQCRALARFEV